MLTGGRGNIEYRLMTRPITVIVSPDSLAEAFENLNFEKRTSESQQYYSDCLSDCRPRRDRVGILSQLANQAAK